MQMGEFNLGSPEDIYTRTYYFRLNSNYFKQKFSSDQFRCKTYTSVADIVFHARASERLLVEKWKFLGDRATIGFNFTAGIRLHFGAQRQHQDQDERMKGWQSHGENLCNKEHIWIMITL